MTLRTVVRAAPVAVIVIAAALGCSSPTAPVTIDGAKLEQNIKDDSSNTELHLSKVECPRDRVPKANDRFVCTATPAAGGSLVYDVDITSERGEYRYQLAPGQVIDGAEVARLVTADVVAVAPEVADAKVTCPASIVAPNATTTIDCTLSAAGDIAPIVVTTARGKPLDWAYKTP